MKKFIILFVSIILISGAVAVFLKFDNTKNENLDNEVPAISTMSVRNDDLCDYFAISRNGEFVKASGYSATSYIDITGAESLTITMAQNNDGTNYGLAFYDEDKNFVSFVNSPIGSYAVKEVEIKVPENVKYFKSSFFDYRNRKFYGDFKYRVNYAENVQPLKYRPYQDELIFFSSQVNQSLDTNDGSNIKITTGVLALPKNYTQTGAKTKLIMYFHGYSHYVYYGTWGATDNFLQQKQHFLDMGFAVMDCNGARDNNMQPHFTSAGSPQYVNGYRQCYEYIVENYNIDTEIYVVGGSAGGPASINYCYMYDNVKALMLLSAWTNLYNDSWQQGVRDTFVEYLGFENTTTYEIEKTIGYDPALHIKTNNETGIEYIDDLKIPVCAFVGSLEKDHILYSDLYRYINALKVCNSNVNIVEWQDKNHTQIVSGAEIDIDTAIIEYFNSI